MYLLVLFCILCLFIFFSYYFCGFLFLFFIFFFFKQKTAYEMRISDWSSDVCSSDLQAPSLPFPRHSGEGRNITSLLAIADSKREIPACAGMTDRSEPLALYVHWPFCVSKCPYCDFNSHVRASVDPAQWRKALLAAPAHEAGVEPTRRPGASFFRG